MCVLTCRYCAAKLTGTIIITVAITCAISISHVEKKVASVVISQEALAPLPNIRVIHGCRLCFGRLQTQGQLGHGNI